MPCQKTLRSLFLCLAFILASCGPSFSTIQIVEDKGISGYQIVLPQQPTAAENRAATVLQQYITRIAGVELAIVRNGKKRSEPAIYIGRSDKTDRLYERGFAPESFLVRTDGKDLLICGGSGKGVVYGVYHLLEKYLGCRKTAGEPALVPHTKTVELPSSIDDKEEPAFVYREAYYPASLDAEYLEWHALHHLEDLFGLWGHSFFKLVPPNTYYKQHPEYYALVNGKRVATQLCLSNPQVLDIVTADLKRRMAKRPDAEYWSVSQNDELGNCTCPQCAATDAREGGPQGSLIQFVNSVAERFPDKKITTLAYAYTRHPTKSLKPAKNVVVMLSSIDAYRDKPLQEEPSAAGFRKDLDGWGDKAKTIFIWDYVTEFTNYLAPFPDIYTQQANMKYLRDHKVKGLFVQGSGETISDFSELKSYLLAKLLWNPDADAPAVQEDFIKRHYADAAKEVNAYISRIEEERKKSGRKLDIYGNPINEWNRYLTPELLDAYSTMMDKAEGAAEADTAASRHIARIRLTHEYTVLQQAKFYGVDAHGIWLKNKKGNWYVRENLPKKIERFIASCKANGVTELSEGGMNPDQYAADWKKILDTEVEPTIAKGMPVTLANPFVEDYPAKGNGTLTDGTRGFNDFSFNWLCFYNTPMVATVDLLKATPVREVHVHFLDDPRHWIFAPKDILIEVAGEDKQFRPIGTSGFSGAEEHYENTIKEYKTRNSGGNVRYVRVTAKSMSALPDWRPHPTKKPMLACDEVYIN